VERNAASVHHFLTLEDETLVRINDRPHRKMPISPGLGRQSGQSRYQQDQGPPTKAPEQAAPTASHKQNSGIGGRTPSLDFILSTNPASVRGLALPRG